MYHSKCKSYAQQIVATVNSNDSVQVRAAQVRDLTRAYITDKRDNPGTLRYNPSRADDATKRQRVLYKGDRLRRFVERSLRSNIASPWITDTCANVAGITGTGNLLVQPLPQSSVHFAPAAPNTVALPATPPQTLVALPAPLVGVAPVPEVPANLQTVQGTPPVLVTRTERQTVPAEAPPREERQGSPRENLMAAPSAPPPSDFLEQNFPPIDDAKEGEGWFRGATRLGAWSYDEGTADDDAFFNQPS